MRPVSLVACFVLVAATSVMAAPWSRISLSSPWKKPPAAHQWADERELGPYLIRSEFPLRDVHELVQDLGDLQDDIEKTLGLRCQPQAIQIHLFNSKRSYNQYISVRIPEGVNRQALYVPGTDAGRVYAYRHSDLETDVRHETTHALLHTALPYVPIWIDEGFAEYFEVPAGRREKGNPHRGELQNAIRFERWKPDIAYLESKRELLDMKKREYRDSWGIVHFLIHGPVAAQESLATYFEEIQSGDVPMPLSKRLMQRIPNLDQAILDHLMK